jgi:thiamine-phosphate pyrophosphorylase
MDVHARRERLAHARLYLVLEARPRGEDAGPLLDAALRGGVDVVQLREKRLTDEDLITASRPFRAACEDHGALFILNDRPDLSARCAADGVHVGQSDASFEDARAFVGSAGIVGVSASSPQEMLAAQEAGADYVGVQSIFATPTKPDAQASGIWLVGAAARTLTIPWFAIGGIELSNVAEVAAAGAPGVAVVRAIRDAEDPEAAARELRQALDR